VTYSFSTGVETLTLPTLTVDQSPKQLNAFLLEHWRKFTTIRRHAIERFYLYRLYVLIRY
jgi:hypothetical protein